MSLTLFGLKPRLISDFYCGQPTNLGLLSSLSVVSKGSTVRHPVITKSMSELGRVTVTTMLGQLSYIMTDFQSEQLDYDRNGYRTRDVKHRSTLTIPLRHRSMKSIRSVLNLCYQQGNSKSGLNLRSNRLFRFSLNLMY